MQDDRPTPETTIVDRFMRRAYEQTGGPTAELRRVYEAYLDNERRRIGSTSDLAIRAESILANCRNCDCEECVKIRNAVISQMVECLRAGR